MITILSRYKKDVSESDGKTIAVRKDVDDVYVYNYVIKSGDTIENLAAKLFGEPSHYWRIADLNPQVAFPFDLEVGSTIRIPQ